MYPRGEPASFQQTQCVAEHRPVAAGNPIVQANFAQHTWSTLILAAQRERRSYQDFQPPAQSFDDAGRDSTGVGRPDLLTRGAPDRRPRPACCRCPHSAPPGWCCTCCKAGRATVRPNDSDRIEPAFVFPFSDCTDAALPRQQNSWWRQPCAEARRRGNRCGRRGVVPTRQMELKKWRREWWLSYSGCSA